MAKKVFVTGAQTAAAQAILKRDAAKGKTTRTAVKKMASASALSQARSKSGTSVHSTKSAAVEAGRRVVKD